MERLCYGIFVKILELNAMPGITRRHIHDILAFIIDPEDKFNLINNPSKALRWTTCETDFHATIEKKVWLLKPKDAVAVFTESILDEDTMDSDKLEIAALTLRHIIQNDKRIKPTTYVDLVNKTTKQDLLSSPLSTSPEFFAGVFLFAIRAHNSEGRE